jgi:hypothetical protein
MTRDEMLTRLLGLLPAQFDVVRFRGDRQDGLLLPSCARFRLRPRAAEA